MKMKVLPKSNFCETDKDDNVSDDRTNQPRSNIKVAISGLSSSSFIPLVTAFAGAGARTTTLDRIA